MARNIITALDVGTSTVQTVVAERKKGADGLRILGVGIAPAAGVRKGVVYDIGDATASIKESVAEARRVTGVPIKSVWLTVGGANISVSSSRGVVAVSRADGEISVEDARRAVAAAESFLPKSPNREVLHIIPRDFKVDGEAGIKDPVGMHGVRLEADTIIIECSTPPLKNLLRCVENAGLNAVDYVFGPLAAAEAVLSKRQKELGVVLLDIGGGTASFIVFEEGMVIHAGVVPVGGNHITNDIAIGFKTDIDVAEQVKTVYGSCLPADLSRRDSIKLADLMEGEEGSWSRRELAEIIQARLGDVFELLQKELKKIDRVQLLPAGVVLVGGSSMLPGILELTKREVKLPVQVGMPHEFIETLNEKIAPSLAAALGLIQWADNFASGKKEGWSTRKITSMRNSPWLKWLGSLLP